MNLELVEKIADAVLYEGYMLYPYRASSVKNRQRFNWGALAPQSYSAATKGTEACLMQTEFLISGDDQTKLNAKARFLHLTMREIGKLEYPSNELPENFEDFQLVPSLEAGGRLFQTWQEAAEREVDFPTIIVDETENKEIEFSFPQNRQTEPVFDENKKIVGVIVRAQQEIKGEIRLRIIDISKSEKDRRQKTEDRRQNTEDRRQKTEDRTRKTEDQKRKLFKVTVQILNTTPFEKAETQTREDAILRSTISTHTILSVTGGAFISLIDPPDELKEAVTNCKNIGTYPVLAGTEGETDCLLSSPIILYDYPQIAPESAGELFDGTEIDEILTLRIMTLTDEEKREMRETDERARKILERTEIMPEEQLLKMHGALRGLAKSTNSE